MAQATPEQGGALFEPRRCRNCYNCWTMNETSVFCRGEFWDEAELELKLSEFLIIDMMAESCIKYEEGPGIATDMVERALRSV